MESFSKQPKKASNSVDKANSSTKDRARMDKQVVKAVLASPLVVPWPNIPNHIQKTVLLSLPKLVPDTVAEYHVARARCHTKGQRQKRKNKHSAATGTTTAEPAAVEGEPEHAMVVDPVEQPAQPISKPTAMTSAPRSKERLDSLISPPLEPPEILQHLVLGINETIKSLERSIDDLKMRLMIMADALNGVVKPVLAADSDGLLPTAPQDPEDQTAISLSNPIPGSALPAPPAFIVIPLQSISPPTLVNPIPQYCATYNALVHQWSQLRKHVEAKLKGDHSVVVGELREEVRVVPLGDVEAEMAKMVGLRRLACVAIRISHPSVHILHELLPKSVLQPPRHKITLPYVTSILAVHGTKSKRKSKALNGAPAIDAPAGATLPHVHFAPLTIKGITTTAPVDGQARKAKRLEEIRARRKEVKERKRQDRLKEMKKGLKGEPPTRHRKGNPNLKRSKNTAPG